MNILEDLLSRGLVHTTSSWAEDLLRNKSQVTLYIGFDPTSDSLHVGSLLGLITAIRFLREGHKVIALIGGATGLIGDPSGKSKERNLLDEETTWDNSRRLFVQIKSILDSEDKNPNLEVVNNISWFQDMNMLTFLRDIGKHVKVNVLLNKDSVKSRLDSEEGISFTEFAYSLMQAFDFAHLAKEKDCVLQVGGSDQWGNIVAGIDLTKKLFNKEVHGLTFPLITKADGTKFGKTESGTIWLDKNKTSPFQFHQFWLNLSDEEALKLAPWLLLIPLEELEELTSQAKAEPNKRVLQNRLANDLTLLVHGEPELNKSIKAGRVLFDGSSEGLTAKELEEILGDVPVVFVGQDEIDGGIIILDLLVKCKMASSRTEARKLIRNKGVSINGKLVLDEQFVVTIDHMIEKSILLIKKGKRDKQIVKVR